MLAILLPCALAQLASYTDVNLDFNDLVDTVVAEDLNGDGKKDLIVQTGVELQIFLQAGGTFKTKPDYTIRLDDITFLWTLARFSDKGYDLNSIVTMSSRGVHRWRLKDNAYKQEDLVITPTIFEGKSSAAHPPIHIDFAPDFNNDGLSDLMLFTKDRLMLFAQSQGEFKLVQKLDLQLDSTLQAWFGAHQRLVESTRVPFLAFGDINGDKRPDLVVYRDQSIQIFTQDAQGHFQSRAEALPLVKDRKKPRQRYFEFDVPPRIVDVNNDGLLDLVVTLASSGKVHIYYGAKGRTDWTEPDEEREISDAWSGGTDIVDFAGDGRKDLVMWIIPKLGIISGIDAFVSKRVAIDLYFFKMQANGRYEKEASQKLSFKIPYSIKLTRESGSAELVFEPNFEGDLNHDGLRDLMVMEEHKLVVYPGDRQKLISSSPIGSIPFNPPAGTSYTKALVQDLNGDGTADILLRHINLTDEKTRLEIKLSK